MARQIDEDVYPVAMDQVGDFVRRHPACCAPDIGQIAQPFGKLVRRVPRGIAVDLDCRPVALFEHGHQEQRNHVILKIPRHVADAKAPIRIRNIFEWGEARRMELLQALTVVHVAGEQVVDRDVVLAVQRKHFRRLEIESIGAMFASFAESIQRVLDPALGNQDGPQHLVGSHVGPVDFNRAPENGFRFRLPGHAFENQPVIEQQVQPVWTQLQRRFRRRRRFFQVALGQMQIDQRSVHVERCRRDVQRLPEIRFRFGGLSQFDEQGREPVAGVEVARLCRHGAAQRGGGVIRTIHLEE